MRCWRAQPDTGAGALFGYLAAGKRSVAGDPASAEVLALLAAADVVITDLSAGWTLADITAAAPPSAVVIAITPFGTTGPYVDAGLQVNEFLLQALCGSIGSRGWPGSEPMQAGGRIGEWFAGTYAAVAAAASVRAAATDRLAARPSTCRSSRRWSSPWGRWVRCRPACSAMDSGPGLCEAWSCRRSSRPPTEWWGSAPSPRSSFRTSWC